MQGQVADSASFAYCSCCLTLLACCASGMQQAFDVLERLDPNPEFYEAKRGAAVGVLQMIAAGKEQVGPGSVWVCFHCCC